MTDLTLSPSHKKQAPAPVPAWLTALQEEHAGLNVALVHDWLLGMRGGEWVLDSLLKLLPWSTVHTLFYRSEPFPTSINRHKIAPSPLSHLPAIRRYYRWLLPLMPKAAERLRINPQSDLVFTTSHCVAHGARAPQRATQINYYFSPMRYLYDQQASYAQGGASMSTRLLETVAPRLRRWDHESAQRADELWTLSHFVADRIKRVFGREAKVIYPPVRTELFTPVTNQDRTDEALVVSALVPYKRVDLAVNAAIKLNKPLRVVGNGPLLKELRQWAAPYKHIVIEGPVNEARLLELYRTRRCLLFPGEEDFGIVPLEAMACGMPVLGLRAGGLLETLPGNVGGDFFDAPSVEELCASWESFNPGQYSVQAMRAHAENFSERHFLEAISDALTEALHRSNA